MDNRITIDDLDADDLAQILELVIKHSNILDKEFGVDAYKFYGQIEKWIKILRGRDDLNSNKTPKEFCKD